MPLGVWSIICSKVLEVEDLGSLIAQLGLFILTIIIGIFSYQLIFLQIIYVCIIRKNPFRFYLGVLPSPIAGFALQSS
jgi:Na+/H+-dicarboxylate symporter